MWMFIAVNAIVILGLPFYFLVINRNDMEYLDIKEFTVLYSINIVFLTFFDLLLMLS